MKLMINYMILFLYSLENSIENLHERKRCLLEARCLERVHVA